MSLEDNQGNRAVVEPVKATCQTLPGNYDLIIGRIILGLGTLTTDSEGFIFQIEPRQHIPTHEWATPTSMGHANLTSTDRLVNGPHPL